MGFRLREAYDGANHIAHGPKCPAVVRALLARECMRDLNRPDDRAVRQLALRWHTYQASEEWPLRLVRRHARACVQRVPAVTVGLGGEG